MTLNCPSPKLLNYPGIKVAIPFDPCYLQVQPMPAQESIIILYDEYQQPLENPCTPAEDCQSIPELFTAHSIVMHPARYAAWRLTNLHSAMIKGQPYLGLCTLVATDGVHGFVITPSKPWLFRIHITNFLGKVERRGASSGQSYSPKGEKKERKSKADRLSEKADQLFQELGI